MIESDTNHSYQVSNIHNMYITIQPTITTASKPLHSSYTSIPAMILATSVGNDKKDESSRVTLPKYPTWHNTIAGAVAGAGSRMATAPLDLIRIRRQLMTSGIVTYPAPSLYTQIKNVVQTEGGITALYRGNVAAICLWISYAAVQFTTYNATKDILLHTSIGSNTTTSNGANNNNNNSTIRALCESPTAVAFIGGAVAGVCATVTTYPFDICRTIFVAQGNVVSSSASLPSLSTTDTSSTIVGGKTPKNPPKSFYEFITKLYTKQGIRGFYAGAFPAIIQVVPYMGINFAIYDRLTRTTSSDNSSSTTTTSNNTSVSLSAYAGSISGAVSKIIIYPIDTVKRRLQAQAFFGTIAGQHHYYTGMMDCFYSIYIHEGIYSFYRGMFPSVLKTTLSTALTFALYRFTKNILESIYDHHHYNPILQMETSYNTVIIQQRSTPRNESSN